MISPVIVPKEVAEAIEYLRKVNSSNTALLDAIRRFHSIQGNNNSSLIYKHFKGDWDAVMDVLVNGYIVEKDPDDRLRDYYHSSMTLPSERTAIRITLNIMGIEVQGVND